MSGNRLIVLDVNRVGQNRCLQWRGNRKLRGLVSAKLMIRVKIQVFFWDIPQPILHPSSQTKKQNSVSSGVTVAITSFIQSRARTVAAGSGSPICSQDKSQSSCSRFQGPGASGVSFSDLNSSLPHSLAPATPAPCCQVF